MGDDLVSCSTATPWAGELVSIRFDSSLFTACFSVTSAGMACNPVFLPTFPRFRVGCRAMIAPSGVLGNRSVARRGRSRKRTRRLTITPLSA